MFFGTFQNNERDYLVLNEKRKVRNVALEKKKKKNTEVNRQFNRGRVPGPPSTGKTEGP